MALDYLGYEPRHIIDGMITISDPARPPTLPHDGRPTSLGTLDKLPLEALQKILNNLDFQSLSRISQVSSRGRVIVESLPAYRELMHHAPDTLKALAMTKLIDAHSVGTLYAALQSRKCVSCNEFAAFLFLPRCERCCHTCLDSNQTFRVIPISRVTEAFNLTPSQLKGAPIMRLIPGDYGFGDHSDDGHWLMLVRRRRLRLVTVEAARQIALNVHGSVEKVMELFERDERRNPGISRFASARDLMESLSCPPRAGPFVSERHCDGWYGLATIFFPYVRPNAVPERVHLCRGCAWLYARAKDNTLPPDFVMSRAMIPEGLPDDTTVLDALHATTFQARPTTEFLEHITRCYGAMRLSIQLQQSAENFAFTGFDV